MNATVTKTKLAWIRDKAIPAGQPALGHFDCGCGEKIEGVPFNEGIHQCPKCGSRYDGRGYKL